jgi:putative endonuclease
MAGHNELGKKGEQIAFEFLEDKGYKILSRNYKFRKSEIDIVAEFGGKLVIVEVKTRSSTFMAGPHETVTMKKQKEIIRAANAYIEEVGWTGETQFDIVSIVTNSTFTDIDHMKDAFYPVI